MRSLLDWLRTRDPNRYSLHRAVRVAVVMPVMFAFSFRVVDNAEVATFTAFGCFALLLFVDFPGNFAGRLTSYAMLVVIGSALIALATLASRNTALAVIGMAVAGFAVLFAGVLSASVAAGGRAALLLFILPVTLPGGPHDILLRLAGFGIAAAVAVPAAMLVWPSREHDDLRRYAAAACRAIADVVAACDRGDARRAEQMREHVSESVAALGRTFRATAFRPVGLTSGSRALIRLVDELEWLGSVTAALDPAEIRDWPDVVRDGTRAGAAVLRASADVLSVDRRASRIDDHGLTAAITALADARHHIAATTGAVLDPTADADVELPYQGHEVAYAASLVGATVAWAAEADARPVLHRVLGRSRPAASLSPVLQIATSQIERHSVWLQNSVRAGLGMGLAVLVVELTGAQHGFWTVLGALSVLRSNALSTGSTALRALLGTVAGFVVGALLVELIGHSPAVLWAVLPVAVLVAAFAPEAISFAAGQAGFTVVLLILFNIIAPVGWQVGLVRIEDVALGCGVSLIVGLLAWPRGAAAAIGTALGQAYRIGAVYLDRAVAHTLRGTPPPADELRDVLAAGRRLDDALRQYLAERGTKTTPLGDLVEAANGAVRLRLAGEAIAALGADRPRESETDGHFAAATALVGDQAASIRDWYTTLADARDPLRPAVALPEPGADHHTDSVLDALHADLVAERADGVDPLQAKRLYWTSLYLQDLRVLESRLGPQVPVPN